MAKTGAWTSAWAQGPGRQSGAWTLSAAAVAALPFLDAIRPQCNTAACIQTWERVFFIPNLLFMPALLAAGLLAGSWVAQRRHWRFDKRFWDEADASQLPDMPPGHDRPQALAHDLIRRTMHWGAAAAMIVAGIYGFLTTTPIGRRACDPVRFSRPTGLEPCSGPAKWSDALIAYEVWLFIIMAAILAITLGLKSRRFARRGRGRRFPFLRRAAQTP